MGNIASVWTSWGESCGSGMGLTTRGLRAMQLVLTWWSHATHCFWREGHWWDWQLGDWELCSWYWHGGPMQHTAPDGRDTDALSDNITTTTLLSDSRKFHVRQNTIQQLYTHNSLFFKNFNCILACKGLVGASRKWPCSVIIIIIIITHTPVLQSFFHDYPDELAPEETSTFIITVTFRSHPICS